MTKRLSFPIYLVSVIGSALALLVSLALRTPVDSYLGERPLVFVCFALLVALAELRPLAWLSPGDGGEVTASWTFAFALLLLAPPIGGTFVMFVSCAIAELLDGKGFVKMLFNASQTALSLAVGVGIFNVLADPLELARGEGVSPVWVAGALLSAGVAFILNSVFTCIAMALHQQVSVVKIVRDAMGVNLGMDGMLLSLAPIAVVISIESLLLLPLLLVTIWVIFRSSSMALRNRHEATHDQLTAIPNRRYFLERSVVALGEAEGDEGATRPYALLHIDLDGFKGINDRLGHHYGDQVLKEVARRLVLAKRPTDLVARLGGDEFAVLLAGIPDVESATKAAERVHAALCEPIIIEGVPLAVGASIGVALHPTHGHEVSDLLNKADLAMYEAKTAGVGVHVFHEELQTTGVGRLSLMADLADALVNDQLYLVYQPKVELGDDSISGVEALLRWNHPTRGDVPPGRFMPYVEQTDLINLITEHVLRTTMAQLREWRDRGIEVPIAVNLSARSCHDLRFPDRVAALFEEFDVPSHLLQLEITENALMSDPHRAAIVIANLRRMGVGIAIDDFGTGYSSLVNLRSLELDAVKIDKSFVIPLVQRSEEAMIVRSIIELAHNLGLRTIAEGVEDLACLAALRELGCDEVQGYVISQPLLPAELVSFLDRGADQLFSSTKTRSQG